MRTTYNKELRDLGEDVHRNELAKDSSSQELHAAASSVSEEQTPVAQWYAPPLITAVHLQQPTPIDWK